MALNADSEDPPANSSFEDLVKCNSDDHDPLVSGDSYDPPLPMSMKMLMTPHVNGRSNTCPPCPPIPLCQRGVGVVFDAMLRII